MVPPASISSVGLAEFRRAVLELELLDAEPFDRSAVEATHDVPTLAALLVRDNRLTGYQAAALLQGKARGLVVGPYLVLSKCGQGGMGVVFKARHRPTGQVAALKILPPSLARDADTRPAVPARGRGRRPAGSPEHRPDRGREPGPGSPLPGDGIHRGSRPPVDRELGRPLADRSGHRLHDPGGARPGGRPCERDRPPRHQTRQPDARRLGGRPHARSRPGTADRGLRRFRAERDGIPDAIGLVHGHRQLQRPRAGRRRQDSRSPGRHLQPGLHALLPRGGTTAVRRRLLDQEAHGSSESTGSEPPLRPLGRTRDARERRTRP